MPKGQRVAWPLALFDYLVECYAGTEDGGGAIPQPRRMFLWESEGEVRYGNTEAFAQHLIDRYGLGVAQRTAAAWASRTLLDAGEVLRKIGVPHVLHEVPTPSVRPEPQYRVIRKVDAD